MDTENAKSTHSLKVEVQSLAQLQKLANLIVLAITQSSLVFILNGGLGAGKTTLVRLILQGLGCAERIKSPTYNILHEYKLINRTIYHYDLYRTEHLNELIHLDLQDHLAAEDKIIFIEWGAHKGITADIIIDIIGDVGLEHRTITITALSNSGLILLNLLCSLYRFYY